MTELLKKGTDLHKTVSAFSILIGMQAEQVAPENRTQFIVNAAMYTALKNFKESIDGLNPFKIPDALDEAIGLHIGESVGYRIQIPRAKEGEIINLLDEGIKQAVAEEREACAKLALSFTQEGEYPSGDMTLAEKETLFEDGIVNSLCEAIAEVIRARR